SACPRSAQVRRPCAGALPARRHARAGRESRRRDRGVEARSRSRSRVRRTVLCAGPHLPGSAAQNRRRRRAGEIPATARRQAGDTDTMNRALLVVSVVAAASAPSPVAGQTSVAQHAPAQLQPALAPAATLKQIGALLDRRDFAGASSAVDEALRTYPDDAALHNFAGVIDAERHETESAERHFQRAIRLAPRETPAYENLGRLYQERSAGDPAARAKAIDVYHQLLAFDSGNVEGLYQCGFLLA